jgi:aromatic ring-cleaving dioxygenase
VGLIATDGCLYDDGRHIAFISKDEDLMRTFLGLVNRAHIRYRREESEYGGWAFRGQFSYAALYRWLLSVGLMPRKSLVLGAIDVPDENLMPLVRGLLEGDGTVYTLIHHPTPRTYRNYKYERLWTFFNSASRKHVEWIQARLACALKIPGYIEVRRRKGHENPMYRLKYGNRASRVLLPAIYADLSVPRLERKWRKWAGYAARHAINVPRTPMSP